MVEICSKAKANATEKAKKKARETKYFCDFTVPNMDFEKIFYLAWRVRKPSTRFSRKSSRNSSKLENFLALTSGRRSLDRRKHPNTFLSRQRRGFPEMGK